MAIVMRSHAHVRSVKRRAMIASFHQSLYQKNRSIAWWGQITRDIHRSRFHHRTQRITIRRLARVKVEIWCSPQQGIENHGNRLCALITVHSAGSIHSKRRLRRQWRYLEQASRNRYDAQEPRAVRADAERDARVAVLFLSARPEVAH